MIKKTAGHAWPMDIQFGGNRRPLLGGSKFVMTKRHLFRKADHQYTMYCRIEASVLRSKSHNHAQSELSRNWY